MKLSFVAGLVGRACLVVGLGEGAACSQSCPDIAWPMLTLRLTDSVTGAPGCDANVRVYRAGADPSSAEDLDEDSGCSYLQPSPRGLGRYTVEVERQGYFKLTFDYESRRTSDCGNILTEEVNKSLERDPSQPLETDAGQGD